MIRKAYYMLVTTDNADALAPLRDLFDYEDDTREEDKALVTAMALAVARGTRNGADLAKECRAVLHRSKAARETRIITTQRRNWKRYADALLKWGICTREEILRDYGTPGDIGRMRSLAERCGLRV